jgi:hypothetical protein
MIIMSTKTQVGDSWISQSGVRLVLLSLLFVVAGCAPAATQPVEQATPTLVIEATQPLEQATLTFVIDVTPPTEQATQTPIIEVVLPSGWEMYTRQQCNYSISHPQEMDITSMGPYSWSINFTSTEPSGPDPNFVYVSVIPGDFQGGAGEIYNYDPVATEILLNMQVGESKSVHPDPNMAPGFTYTRLPDTTFGNQTAQTYENTQPWEFPAGAKEIRYYLQANGCTYMFGGYFPSLDSGEPRTMSQELFDEIIATFQANP